ncbi:unnamed protein product [Rangifer tarandus platyrhynchus]|uniref:Uncharacterized protein n=2 Tax=Rangifer tarandus platyrhynchus TaxID=3082113 RepID=A0ABN8XRI0_RANTA|nr:unnamed protein product [Rangifer tarandus platyrhynchus]CAI9690836.1 unnamed protein product [Rangifer tarandus platyrhynchus]
MWCSGSPARARSPARATEHAQSSGRLPARSPRAHSALSGLQAAQAGVVVDRRAKTVARSRGEGGGRGSGELERCALVAGWVGEPRPKGKGPHLGESLELMYKVAALKLKCDSMYKRILALYLAPRNN